MTVDVRGPALRTLGRVRDVALPVIERPLERMSLVGGGPFLPNDRFPWIAELEAGVPEIRAELDAVLSDGTAIPTFQEVLPSQAQLTSDEKWRTFMFYGYGHRVAANCARCPRTEALLKRIPGMTTAFFSILSPGKHIPAHRGFYKGVLRYHLSLKVPVDRERCRIRVGDQFHAWKEGTSVVFDDTYEHEVWNDTEEERVVLFVDFIRPLPQPVALLNRTAVRLIANLPEIRRAARNQIPPD